MGIDKKNTYVMYRAWTPMFLQMDDAELGRLIKDVCRYQDGEEVNSKNPIFALLKQAFEENSRKYEESCNNKRRNAMKGVLKRSTKNAREIYISEMDTEDARALLDMTSDIPEIQAEIANRLRQESANASTCYQMPTNVSKCQHYDNEYENENDNENDNENETEYGNGEKHPHGSHQNIFLTDTEYFSFVRRFGTETVKEAIDNAGNEKRVSRDVKTDYQRVLGCIERRKASCRI